MRPPNVIAFSGGAQPRPLQRAVRQRSNRVVDAPVLSIGAIYGDKRLANEGNRLALLGSQISRPKVSWRFQRTGLVATTVCCPALASSASENATVRSTLNSLFGGAALSSRPSVVSERSDLDVCPRAANHGRTFRRLRWK